MAKERKLDLFAALNKLSVKDHEYYASLSDDEKKEFLPVVIMRWMSGTRDAKQVFFLNEIANPFMYDLHKHKPLLANLLSISASGRSQRYTWAKANTKKSAKSSLIVDIVKEYYGYSSQHAREVLPLLQESDILGFAEELGKQSDEIAKLKKELKAKKDE